MTNLRMFKRSKSNANHSITIIVDVVIEYTGNEPVPKDVTCVRFHPNVVEVEDEAFKHCTKLRKLVLNEGLKKIGKGAFEQCYSLESITLPSTVTNVGQNAFCSCTRLGEVELNVGLQKIGNSAFWNCKPLESIELPSTVTQIGENVFSHCSGLRVVALNDGLQKLRRPGTFYNCKSLERFTFPNISTRLKNIIRCQPRKKRWRIIRSKQTEVEKKIDKIVPCFVEREGFELYVYKEGLLMDSDDWGDIPMVNLSRWSIIRKNLLEIDRMISYYEVKEATTLFELSLWKAKIEQANEVKPRDSYRIDVPGPVKETILQYLYPGGKDFFIR